MWVLGVPFWQDEVRCKSWVGHFDLSVKYKCRWRPTWRVGLWDWLCRTSYDKKNRDSIWWWSRSSDDLDVMIQTWWQSRSSDDVMMIQTWWWSRSSDDPNVMIIQQWWSSSHDDPYPDMKKTWRRRWLRRRLEDEEDSKMKKTWRLRRLKYEDDEMIQLMQRRRPVLKIVSK